MAGCLKKTGRFPTLNLDKAVKSIVERARPLECEPIAMREIGNHTLYITVKTVVRNVRTDSFQPPIRVRYFGAPPIVLKSSVLPMNSIEKTILTNEILVSLSYGSDRSVAESLAAETGGEIGR